MKKSRLLMFASIESYRSGGITGLWAYWESLSQYDHAQLGNIGNDTMAGCGLRRGAWPEKRFELFIQACADGLPLSRKPRGRYSKSPAAKQLVP